MSTISRRGLLELGRLVVKKMEKRGNDVPASFFLTNRLGTLKTCTEGYAVVVGRLYGTGGQFAIWEDLFTRCEAGRVWFGVQWLKARQGAGILKRCCRLFPSPKALGCGDLDDQCEYSRIKAGIVSSLFGVAVVERYGQEGFWGFYERRLGQISKKDKLRLAERIADLFCEVIEAFTSSEDSRASMPRVYPAVRERRRVVSHVIRERCQYLARLRKEKDDWECQICGFRFSSEYGALGDDFAECHHRVPLSKLSPNRPTRIKDLITVCSNCHSMLHRMSGSGGDVSRLRRIVHHEKT